MDETQKPGQAEQPQWNFHAEETGNPGSATPKPNTQSVQWTASEFVEHNKSTGWYGLLALAAVVGSAIIYLLTRDAIATGMIIVAAITFGVFAARKPRELEYEVNGGGVQIAQKFYPYSSFKSFALMSEGSVDSIWLMPLKRFMPILSIYFAPDDSNKIVETISNFLPVEEHQPDPIDRLLHHIRF